MGEKGERKNIKIKRYSDGKKNILDIFPFIFE